MKNIIKTILGIFILSVFLVSCHKDLDQSPIDPDSFTEEDVYSNPQEAKSALAKLYAGLTMTGQEGPAGEPDIDPDIIDEGFSQYTRMLFNLNELTTDHAVVAWGDSGLQDLHGMYWAAGNDFTDAMYYRLAQEISFCNSFIERAESLSADADVQKYIAEARFLRAYAYYNLLDFYANVPLVTIVSTDLPSQSNRSDIFSFIESELLEIDDLLAASGTNEYGRVDEVAAWALLSRLYLNAQTWVGTDRYSDCITYSEMVMNSTYTINMADPSGNGSGYDELFLADNNSNGAQNEFIFVLNFDGIQSQTYGGPTFIIHGGTGGCMDAESLGINGGWGGYRTTSSLVEKFEEVDDLSATIDAMNTDLGAASLWGLVGSATPNGWNGPDQVLYEIASGVYACYIYLTADDNNEFKVRFNNDWAVNYGANEDTPEDDILAGGANLKVCGEGYYYFEVNFNDLSYEFLPYNDVYFADKRGFFFRNGQSLEIEDQAQFSNGYPVYKFKNVTSQGGQGNDAGGTFCDTDLPMIRLAEIYLNYAEAVERGGSGGSESVAVDAINELRERAYGNTNGNITQADLDLEFLLDERSRELYWEGQRRTDLIRFGYFTSGSYVWPWKANTIDGAGTDEFRTIYPIPTNVISANPNLNQNQGY